jgi:hypothetical protein
MHHHLLIVALSLTYSALAVIFVVVRVHGNVAFVVGAIVHLFNVVGCELGEVVFFPVAGDGLMDGIAFAHEDWRGGA